MVEIKNNNVSDFISRIDRRLGVVEDWTDVLLDYWAKGMNGTKTEAQKDFVTAVTAESSLSYQQVKVYFLPLNKLLIILHTVGLH